MLETLPGVTADIADSIVSRRYSSAGPFAGVGDLLTDKTVSEAVFRELAERVTVRSSVFTVESTGTTVWGVQRKILAVIDRGSQPMSILYWYQSE